jgi:hypothetical protein
MRIRDRSLTCFVILWCLLNTPGCCIPRRPSVIFLILVETSSAFSCTAPLPSYQSAPCANKQMLCSLKCSLKIGVPSTVCIGLDANEDLRYCMPPKQQTPAQFDSSCCPFQQNLSLPIAPVYQLSLRIINSRNLQWLPPPGGMASPWTWPGGCPTCTVVALCIWD